MKLAYDKVVDEKLSQETHVEYTDLDRLLSESDIVSLHVPLSKDTTHLIDAAVLKKLKPGALLINVSRGGLVDTKALLEALKTGRLGGAALDVYEGEENYFFRDLSGQILQDDILARLITFPNIIVTSHQAFLTQEALHAIALVTLKNLTAFEKQTPLEHELTPA